MRQFSLQKGLLLILLFLLISFHPGAFAAEKATVSAKIIEAQQVPFVDNLPTPGMLPNNPFYSLKLLRDNVLLFFSPKPLDKARMTLFFSRKTLANSRDLLKHGAKSYVLGELGKSHYWINQSLDVSLPNDQKSLELKMEQLASLRERQILISSWETSFTNDEWQLINVYLTEEGQSRQKLTDQVLESKAK